MADANEIKPEIDDKTLCDIVRRNFDLHVEHIKRLDGYDDLNFKIRTVNKGDNEELSEVPKREYTFKILNRLHTQCPEKVELQHKMMLYLRDNNIPVPEPVVNACGTTYSAEVLPLQGSDTKATFITQLLSYIPGVTFLEAGNPLELLHEVGSLTGKMDKALKNFDGQMEMEKDNLWELRRLPYISLHISSHLDSEDIQMGQEILQAYDKHILPVLDKFQSGIIHGDVNNVNIIVKPTTDTNEPQITTSYVISGIIDFVDACSSFYVYELATVMADIMSSCFHKHNPSEIARLIYTGYIKEFPLSELESRGLKLVICIRLLQSYVLSGMSLMSDPENVYLSLERQEFIELCRYLWKMEDNEFYNKVIF